MNKHQPSMNPKSPARTLRRGYCLAQAMIQWCFSPLARIRWCLILIGWSWGGTISPATPPEGNEWKRPSFNANSNQWQVNSVTQASHAQLVDKTPLDSLPELNMSNRMEEYGSSSPMVCAIWRKKLDRLERGQLFGLVLLRTPLGSKQYQNAKLQWSLKIPNGIIVGMVTAS